MDEMTCPKCQGTMAAREVAGAQLAKCSSCSGIFLERADAGALSEAENDWHIASGPRTEPLPRITADMEAPPPSRPAARSFIESLFDA
jgi:Zn-finger nucleic acid-binding protein